MPTCTGFISPTGNLPSFSRSSHLLPAWDDHALMTGGLSTPSSLSSSLVAAGRTSRVNTARRATALACPIPLGTSHEVGGHGGGRGTIGSTKQEHELLMAAPAYSWVTSFQCPSEMTSTTPSTTCMAV
jgi:hypothetical protein